MDKRKKFKTKYGKGVLVRTADLKRTFSKGDTTNWLYIYYKKLQKIVSIQYRVIALINYQKDIMKLY